MTEPLSHGTEDAAARPVGGKLGLMVALLRRPQGADLSDMMTATGWQQRSIRGALAGALKKYRGFHIVSEKRDGIRMYRIVEPNPGTGDAELKHASHPKPTKAAKTAKAKSAKRDGETAGG